jgi:hypothetical protein
VSLSALHWHPCLHRAGGITSTCAVVFTTTAGLAWASLPYTRWTHHPRGTRVVVSIANWRPPHHDGIVTPQRMWHRHCVIVVVCGICRHNRRRSLATWLLCPANLALVILPALHRRHCPCCAGFFASIALSMPVLRWRCHQCCSGLFTLIALASLPSLPTSHCPPKTQSRHIRVCGVVVVVIVLAHGLIAVPGIVPRFICLRWSCGSSVGLFAGVVLASLAAFHCPVVVASVAPASFSLSCGRFCPRCAGIVALIAFVLPPASRTGVCPGTKQSQHALASLPVSHPCCCQCCAGTIPLVAQMFFALVALPLPLLAHPCCHLHHKLASAQS